MTRLIKDSSSAEIMALKDSGNEHFKNSRMVEAIQKYTKAVILVHASGGTTRLTKRELAVLYGNRAEANLRLNFYKEAFVDAQESTSFDEHWYKVDTLSASTYFNCHF